MQPLINILIRTSGRPNLFRRCIDSVNRQAYTNLRIVVGTDNEDDYIPANVERLCYPKGDPIDHGPFYYNDYCNILKDEVKDGWFLFLDDDDFLLHERVLQNISAYLLDTSRPIICQFERRNKPKPMAVFMETGQIVSGHIGLPCIIQHASIKNAASIKTDTDNTDYKYIKAVCDKHSPVFVKQVVVGTDRRSYGTRIDSMSKAR